MFEKRGKTGYAKLVVGATHRVALAGKILADLHQSPKGVLSSALRGRGGGGEVKHGKKGNELLRQCREFLGNGNSERGSCHFMCRNEPNGGSNLLHSRRKFHGGGGNKGNCEPLIANR